MSGHDKKPTEEPPASRAGLIVETGRADDTKLDPARPLRCFVGGAFVGEITLAECAKKNGVATGALDVGVDETGALAAADQAGMVLTPLPPTPTGKPLIFEKTISFQPFDSDGPPLYKNDCLPDPPAFRNPFMWDGKSPQVRTVPVPGEKPDPAALEECLKQLPEDSIEAEGAHDKRQLEQWGSSKLGR